MNQNYDSNLSSNNFSNKKQLDMKTKRDYKNNMRSNTESPSKKNNNYLKELGKVGSINDINSTLQNMRHFSNNNIFYQNKSTPPLLIKKNHANGIVNIGASCYMNATIQCLAHVENLTKHFLKPKNMEKIISNKYKYKLSNSFLEVLKNLWLNNKIKYYSPDDFKNIISVINPLFAGI